MAVAGFENRRSGQYGTQILRFVPAQRSMAALSYARARMFATDCAYHWPPRAVAIPRALSALAISLSVRAPAFWASPMIGSTFAAKLSASAFTAAIAFLRATRRRGFPKVTP